MKNTNNENSQVIAVRSMRHYVGTKNKSFNGINKKQSGFGVLGLFTGAFLLMFFSTMTIALLPLYLDNFSVRSCLTSLAEDKNILSLNDEKIKTALLTRLSISNVNSVSRKDITIAKSTAGIKINVDYIVQAKFIKNLDFIVHFDEQKEISL